MPLIWINSAAPSLAPQVPPAPASLQTVFPAIPGPHLPSYVPVRHIDEPLGLSVHLTNPIFASKAKSILLPVQFLRSFAICIRTVPNPLNRSSNDRSRDRGSPLSDGYADTVTRILIL